MCIRIGVVYALGLNKISSNICSILSDDRILIYAVYTLSPHIYATKRVYATRAFSAAHPYRIFNLSINNSSRIYIVANMMMPLESGSALRSGQTIR